MVVVIFTQMVFGMIAGVGMLLFVCAGVGPIAYRNRAGRNGWQIVTANLMWLIGVRRKQNLYRSGVAGPVPYGTHKLPGLLAPSKAYEAVDAGGKPFAMLHIPATRHVAVVLACEPEGSQLVDQETTDLWVALYGRFLAELAVEPSLEVASVTVETAGDPGTRLSAEVDLLRSPNAPAFADAVLDEIKATYALGAAAVTGRITLVYGTTRKTLDERPRGRRHKTKTTRSRVRKPAEMAEQIGNRLPGSCAGLSATGGGVSAMTIAEVAEMARIAYDPAVGPQIEAVPRGRRRPRDHLGERRTGRPGGGLGLPAPRLRSVDHLADGRSTPRPVRVPTYWSPLLRQTGKFLRKRVPWSTEPHSPQEAAKVRRRRRYTMIGQSTARRTQARPPTAWSSKLPGSPRPKKPPARG